MQVHRSIDNLPGFLNAVITIGTFDGVHEGHKKIIDAVIREARSVQGEAIIITFHPHPRKIVNPNEHLQLINTLEEKISLHPHTIIIGYDHHFGKGREGNFMLLAEKADIYNYRLLEIPKYILQEVAVSSTQIRNALLQSDVETANKLLGYEFFFEGIVIEGDKLGRKLGYPTANLEYTDADKIHLGHGVYAAYAEVNGRKYKGMLSIGNRPTLVNSNERVEVNIFDFDEEIYGETIKVMVKKYLRGQEKYSSLDELKDQLALDKENSLAVL